MPLTAVFFHGWGFDSGIWDRVSRLLGDWPALYFDRGYFGAPGAPVADGPCIAVTHSFGTMLALRDPPAHCAGILAINGFDRFVAAPGSPGVPGRIVERMTARFDEEPEAVLHEFRRRCGWESPFTLRSAQVLGEDLRRLATMDCTAISTRTELPILSLQGSADPILPEAMRAAVFAKTRGIQRATIAKGGHLLPLTEPEACARAIRDFAEVIA